MQKPPPQPPVFGENIAGRLFDVVRTLQKNREQMSGMRRATPIAQQRVEQGQEVMNLLSQKNQNGQEQNAASAPGALQKEGSQERGRQRNV
jgi:hypothetical protein